MTASTRITRIHNEIHYVHAESAEPMVSRALSWAGFTALVRAVTDAGLPPPAQYLALMDRFARLQAIAAGDGRAMQHRLTEAVTHGTDVDLVDLFAAALSERTSTASERQAELLGEVRDAVLHQGRALIATSAERNYRTLADRFDNIAAEFTHCARIIDPATPSDRVMDADTKTLEAWRDGARVAAQLDELVEPLASAAELVRRLDQPSGFGTSTDPLRYSLL
jgi:hypothetical protein